MTQTNGRLLGFDQVMNNDGDLVLYFEMYRLYKYIKDYLIAGEDSIKAKDIRY